MTWPLSYPPNVIRGVSSQLNVNEEVLALAERKRRYLTFSRAGMEGSVGAAEPGRKERNRTHLYRKLRKAAPGPNNGLNGPAGHH